jgi:signal transduction histidine kinase
MGDRIDEPPAPSKRPKRFRWRHTLYARASLLLLLGGAALVGALIALSTRLVDESVDRLLVERTDFARTVGGLIELHLLGDLQHLGGRVAPLLREGAEPDRLAEALASEYPLTFFQEGVVVLDARGEPLVALPSGPRQILAALDLMALAERAGQGAPVISPVVHIPVGDRPVLVAMMAIAGEGGATVGYVAGVLQPTATDLLSEVGQVRGIAATELELIDAGGTVVASTANRTLYRSGDHGEVLEAAITDRREFKGRCHSCHEQGDSMHRRTDVMAFAPLPTLGLGLAVYQKEDEALAPAFALRQQLSRIVGVVVLFVVFMGFAVHSVVRPVVRLTRAVDALETRGETARLPSFGRDEVGRLARSVELWRGRMVESLAAAEASQARERAEADSVRQHLAALEDIAKKARTDADVESLLTASLDHILRAAPLAAGVLRLQWGVDQFEVAIGAESEAQRRLSEIARQTQPGRGDRESSGAFAFRQLAASERRGAGTRAVCSYVTPQGMRVAVAMESPGMVEVRGERWVRSLVYHACMGAMNRILADRDKQRQREQERYLRGVLDAQEEERSRIARDLHDTIAQDLAALRLDLERQAGRLEPGDFRRDIEALEARTARILQTTRGILLDLRLTVLDSLGLVATLQWHLERVGREHGLRGTLSVDGEERALGYYLSVALLRIFQECLNNVVQHAEAEHVFVTVAFEPTTVELTVEDDGRGFQPVQDESGAHPSGGLGLLGMRERARLLGGTLTLESSPGEGTTVRVAVPESQLQEEAA